MFTYLAPREFSGFLPGSRLCTTDKHADNLCITALFNEPETPKLPLPLWIQKCVSEQNFPTKWRFSGVQL